MNNRLILKSEQGQNQMETGGGKAQGLTKLSKAGYPVPAWFAITEQGMLQFIAENDLDLPALRSDDLNDMSQKIRQAFIEGVMPESILYEVTTEIQRLNLGDEFLAVRSSGMDEDSQEHSFAGQFSSFLYQKGMIQIEYSIKECWASAYSERALSYRKSRGLPLTGHSMGVIIQKMVHSQISGVAFSRNPLDPTDRNRLVIDSLYGQGEGLVGGLLDADHYMIDREKLTFECDLAHKSTAMVGYPKGGLKEESVPQNRQDQPSLSPIQVKEVARLAIDLEDHLTEPQDIEWAYEDNQLYLLQTRPITTIPSQSFFDSRINGQGHILWDNSNIIESYSGVTSPLTFSFASNAYYHVYRQFCQVVGVPQAIINQHDGMFRNMLGLMRGRIYYNLVNWYRLLLLLPGTSNNNEFMETMMGVQQNLNPDVRNLFDFIKDPPRYSLKVKIKTIGSMVYRFLTIDKIIHNFQEHFNKYYEWARQLDLKEKSVAEIIAIIRKLEERVLMKWQAPIINDYLVMICFGILGKLIKRWIQADSQAQTLQNDLLVGEGDLKSTEPTKMLMRLAERLDLDPKLAPIKKHLLQHCAQDSLKEMESNPDFRSFHHDIQRYLDLYGFRCVDELKLEATDLHDDPSFIVEAIKSYIKNDAYHIHEMEKRERLIRLKAETTVKKKLKGPKKMVFFWVLKQARRTVSNRENLRFDRTKIFGVVRHLYRAIGEKLEALQQLDHRSDIFYLSQEEIFSYAEGRAITLDLRSLVATRKKEFSSFQSTTPPPDRFMTQGAAGLSASWSSILQHADLLRDEQVSDDPDTLLGTSCCPGVVEGKVRVAHTMDDARDLEGEILVTGRTDPGWVPLYPSCSGLVIERGSLLSHSAVVARELGLPTIVGVKGGLLERLKTGMTVRVDAGKGTVTIISGE